MLKSSFIATLVVTLSLLGIKSAHAAGSDVVIISGSELLAKGFSFRNQPQSAPATSNAINKDHPIVVPADEFTKLKNKKNERTSDWSDYAGIYASVLGTAHSLQPAFLAHITSGRRQVKFKQQDSQNTLDFPYTRKILKDYWSEIRTDDHPSAYDWLMDNPRLTIALGFTTGSIKTGADDVSNDSSMYVGLGVALNQYVHFDVGMLSSIVGGSGASQRLAVGFSFDPQIIGQIFK